MKRADRIRLIVTVIVVGLSIWFLWPTYRLATMSKEEQQQIEVENPEKIDKLHKKALKLGLDLRGGMHLTYEVDDSQLKSDEKKDALDRAVEIIRNRVDQFSVSEPVIQKEGSKRIIVQLPGIQDPERAKRLLGQTAMLEWRLIRQQQEVAGVLRKLDDAFKRMAGDSLVEVNPEAKEDTTGAIGAVPDTTVAKTSAAKQAGAKQAAAKKSAAKKTAAKKAGTKVVPAAAPEQKPPKLNPFGKQAPGESLFAQTKTAGNVPLNVPLETVDKNKPFSSLLASFYRDWIMVREENIPLVRRMLARPEAQQALPKDSEFMWYDEWMNLPDGGRGKPLMLVAKDEPGAYVSGSNLIGAEPQANPQAPTQLSVAFTFNRKGARDLSRFTGDNVGRFTAIILDGKIKSFPVIKSKIPDGHGIIEGTFTDVEARDLSIVLRAGALPAPMMIREERTVGPSLGSDSIHRGLRAGLFGAASVVAFMCVYYELSGLIASTGILITMLVLFGCLAYFGAALTLPGIAGLVLTVGVAVDANVLIYERIREELRRGKTIPAAVEAGYTRAFITILDANTTTLVAAVALWQFGTGPIKGFATTLSVGVIASVFSACVFCRLIFDLWVRRPLKRLSI